MSLRRTLGAKGDALRRARIHAEARGLAKNPGLDAFLDGANLQIIDPPTTGAIRADVADFAHHTFARFLLPEMTFEWPRTQRSADRIVVLLVKPDSLDISSTQPVLRRDPGVFLIPPGTAPVRFQLSRAAELVYISSDRSLLGDAGIPTEQPVRITTPVPAAVTAPLMGFVAAICSVDADDAADAAPLAHAAREIVRSFIALFDDHDHEQLDLHAAAMQIMQREHARVDLSGDVIAARLGVSIRTLQASFAGRGQTVSHELRTIRADAARSIRAKQPALPLRQLAAVCGFGSVSALTRALRETDAASA